MTRKEAVALLERYSNYDGMGIPNLAGCKEAMRVAVDALKEACPELRESEDERIRKELVAFFKEMRDTWHEIYWHDLQVEGILAWLEKQKDIEDRWIEDRGQCFWNGVEEGKMLAEKQKEQKPVEHSAKGRRGRMGGIPEYVRRKAEAFKDKMEPPYDADDICTAYEAGALESAKPAELEQLAKLREMTHEILDAYERGIEVGRVESKQEWSEEDEKMLRTIISDGSRGVELDSKQISWLKSLRPVSKESLQPHWKPSEEQMNALYNVINPCDHVDKKALESLYEQLKKL